MSRHHDSEPLLVRQRYGNRWVYHHRNPGGLALVVITPIVAVLTLWALSSGIPR
ncbi:hypothetical protein ACFZB6_10870 [Streptomyces syringium]|uniref:hypothetical protein n=1 Tax=Streptomyces TaxID=1883 RepID=UPI0033B9C72F